MDNSNLVDGKSIEETAPLDLQEDFSEIKLDSDTYIETLKSRNFKIFLINSGKYALLFVILAVCPIYIFSFSGIDSFLKFVEAGLFTSTILTFGSLFWIMKKKIRDISKFTKVTSETEVFVADCMDKTSKFLRSKNIGPHEVYGGSRDCQAFNFIQNNKTYFIFNDFLVENAILAFDSPEVIEKISKDYDLVEKINKAKREKILGPILYHEIGHVVFGDSGPKKFFHNSFEIFTSTFALVVASIGLFYDYSNSIYFIYTIISLNLFVSILKSLSSKQAEFRADLFAAAMTSPGMFITAFSVLAGPGLKRSRISTKGLPIRQRIRFTFLQFKESLRQTFVADHPTTFNRNRALEKCIATVSSKINT